MADPNDARPRARTTTPQRPSPAVIRRRRIVVASAAGAVVILVALATAFLWPGFAIPDPLPTPTITATAPVPTPTVSPAPRKGEATALTKAVPDTVGVLVQQKIANYPAWQDKNDALESWTFTYADGEGEGARTVTLLVGQWQDDKTATSFYDAQVKAAGATVRKGDVKVGGKAVGTYAISGTADAATMWWRNGTVVMRTQGTQAALEAFYSAFPL